jgi:hypothetical protein
VSVRLRPVDAVSVDVICGRNITGENANWLTLAATARFSAGPAPLAINHRAPHRGTFVPSSRFPAGAESMINRNILYAIIGALIVVVAVLGYNLHQERKKPDGFSLNVSPSGLKIEKQ